MHQDKLEKYRPQLIHKKDEWTHTGIQYINFPHCVKGNIYHLADNKDRDIAVNHMRFLYEDGWNFDCLSYHDFEHLLLRGEIAQEARAFLLTHTDINKFTQYEIISLIKIDFVRKELLRELSDINLSMFSQQEIIELFASVKEGKQININGFNNDQKFELLRVMPKPSNSAALEDQDRLAQHRLDSSERNLQKEVSEINPSTGMELASKNTLPPAPPIINLDFTNITPEQTIIVLTKLVRDISSLQAAKVAGLDLTKISSFDSKDLSALVSKLDKQILEALVSDYGLDLTKIIGFNDVALVVRNNQNNHEKLEFLLNHGFASVQQEGASATTSAEDVNESASSETILDMLSNALIGIYRKIQAPVVTDNTIPKKMHYIWLASPNNPKELFQKDSPIPNLPYKYVFDNKVKLYSDWEHTLWVNDKNLIPYTVEIAENMGIHVKELKDLKTGRSTLVEKLSQFQQPKPLASSLMSDIIQDMAMKSQGDQHINTAGGFVDTAKYLIVESEGGMIADLNYHFVHKLSDEELSKSTFIAPFNTYTKSHLPYLLAATPKHHILSEALNKIEIAFKNGCKYAHEGHNECGTSVLFNHYNSIVKQMVHSDPYKDSYGKVDSKVDIDKLEYDYWLNGELFGMDGFEQSWKSI